MCKLFKGLEKNRSKLNRIIVRSIRASIEALSVDYLSDEELAEVHNACKTLSRKVLTELQFREQGGLPNG